MGRGRGQHSVEPSPPPGGTSAIAVAGGEAKRARKRSRYLSPPYTDTHTEVNKVEGQEEEEEGPPPDVCAADVLSALHAAALLSLDPNAGQALRFLTLYINSRRRKTNAAATVGYKPLLNLPTGTGTDPATEMRTPAPGSKKEEQNPQQPAPATMKANAGHKRASQSPDDAGNANNSAPPKRRKNKKMMNKNSSTGQEHFRNPVALVLDFAQATPLPSRDDLLSTFRKFGSVIHSETDIVKGQRRARVVFATRAEAEAAYSCAEILGTFGPPFAAPSLQDHPPITAQVSPPVPRLPLKDVRKNLEKMILSLTSSFKADLPHEAKPAMGHLVGEMQGLLAKVDKMLQGSASSTVQQH